MPFQFPARADTIQKKRRYLARVWYLLHHQWRRHKRGDTGMTPEQFQAWRTGTFQNALRKLTAIRGQLPRPPGAESVWGDEADQILGHHESDWDSDIDPDDI